MKAKNILLWVAVLFILYLGVKPWLVSMISVKEYILLDNMKEGSLAEQIIFTPKNEMILLKGDGENYVLGLYKIKGNCATKYFGGVYLFGSSPFGLRYYSNADYVFEANLKMLKNNDSSLPEIGKEFLVKVVIKKEEGSVGSLDYIRVDLDSIDIEELKDMVYSIYAELNYSSLK
jgi:hypothetical protein